MEIIAAEIEKDLAGWIFQLALPDRQDAKKPAGTVADYPGDFTRLLRRLRSIFSDRSIVGAFESVASSVDEFSLERLSRIPGIDPSRIVNGGAGTIARFRAANVALIESLPAKMAADIGATLAQTDVRGLHVKDVGRVLQERFQVSKSKAQLIARDQTLKLYANVNEERSKAAGVNRYEWQHSEDERVRGNPGGLWPKGGDHWSLGGKVFSYDAPPVVDPRTGKRGNPGSGDFGCRCTGYPVFD